MNNMLSGTVQSFPVVWYHPDGFPNIDTDADLIDQDGEFLLVHTGYEYRLIHASEKVRIVGSKQAELEDSLQQETMTYAARFEIGSSIAHCD